MIPLEYLDGLPAWRIRVVRPQRFRDVPCVLKTRLFCMPQGALLTALVKLYDVEDQPYFIHRVMDLSDAEVRRYVSSCAGSGRMALVFEAVGQEAGFRRDVAFDNGSWERCLEEGTAYNGRVAGDGDAALRAFLDVFTSKSGARGVEAAWEEVDRRCCSHIES